VIPPSGEEIFYNHRESKCGGKQDVDMNITFQGASMKPVEHILWEKKAPSGHYRVKVHHFTNHGKKGCEDPTHFVVSVRSDNKTETFYRQISWSPQAKAEGMQVCQFFVEKGRVVHFGPKKGATPKKDKTTTSSNAGCEDCEGNDRAVSELQVPADSRAPFRLADLALPLRRN